MKSLSKTLLAGYLLILLWLILFKLSFNLSAISGQARSLNLVPFANTSLGNLRDVIVNFVGFFPLGVLLGVNFKRAKFWRKLAFIFIFSFAVETIQYIFAIGATDITDVITNTSGGCLGLMLYELSKQYLDTEKLDRFIVVTGTILLTLFILILGVLFSHNVRYQSAPLAGKHRLRT